MSAIPKGPLKRRSKASEAVVGLTPRQLGVAKLIAVGKMNKEIADELGISLKTIEKHRGAINGVCGVGGARVAHFMLIHGLVRNIFEGVES